jgi:hypothetical protein
MMNSVSPIKVIVRLAVSVCAAVVLVPWSAAAADTPLGLSTAIADFNADGRPDVAVANHLSNHGGNGFRIEFKLSNGQRQFVSFASAQPALRVTAVDIDNDHDMDLVVTPLLGQHVIGVWLNDGAGNFEKGRAHDYAPLTSQLSTATLTGMAPQLALATPSPRRALALLPAARAPAVSSASSASRLVSSTNLPSRFLARNLAPRAPPAHA